jgi:hypothetical protein
MTTDAQPGHHQPANPKPGNVRPVPQVTPFVDIYNMMIVISDHKLVLTEPQSPVLRNPANSLKCFGSLRPSRPLLNSRPSFRAPIWRMAPTRFSLFRVDSTGLNPFADKVPPVSSPHTRKRTASPGQKLQLISPTTAQFQFKNFHRPPTAHATGVANGHLRTSCSHPYFTPGTVNC